MYHDMTCTMEERGKHVCMHVHVIDGFHMAVCAVGLESGGGGEPGGLQL